MLLRYSYLGLLSLSALTACRKDNFEPDPANKQLPIYSEQGKNRGGALINGQAWRAYVPKGLVAHRQALVVSIESRPDTLVLMFDGDMFTQTKPVQHRDIWFKLRRSSSASFTVDSLLNLHNRRFVLDGKRYSAATYTYQANGRHEAGRGELYVKRVQRKALPNDPGNGQPRAEYILSGTFRFTAYSRTDSVQVTEGRFDHRIRQLERY